MQQRVTVAAIPHPYSEGTHHEQTSHHRYTAELIVVLGALQAFVLRHLRSWSKDLEEVSPDGLRFALVYNRQLSQQQQLLPTSWPARFKEASEAHGNRRYSGAYRSLRYELTCGLDLTWQGGDGVDLRWHAVEDIDVNVADERPIGRHYHAPSQFLLPGWPGDELNSFMINRLRG
jgi:hypothetical protein